ncbi:CENP-B homolog protein 1-like [Haliotis rubra]|uniref:CENP-B homolog protein 1-like n=1 Tax=Haliotis rubra TaxID=36100 RepID=UPI001EE5BC51|nr:CENP-B homolog protein 1-like [Haliotis rubra]
MDAGIIRTFKAYYKRSLVRHYITYAEEGRDQKLTVRQALLFVKTSWDEVSAQTISNCYRHVDIISHEGDSDSVDEDGIALSELRLLLNEYPSSDVVSAEEYVAEEDSESTCEPLTDSAIIDIVQPTDDCEEEEEERDPAPVPPSSTEAEKYLESLVTYFETIGDEMSLGKIIDVKNSMKKVKRTQTTMTDFLL